MKAKTFLFLTITTLIGFSCEKENIKDEFNQTKSISKLNEEANNNNRTPCTLSDIYTQVSNYSSLYYGASAFIGDEYNLNSLFDQYLNCTPVSDYLSCEQIYVPAVTHEVWGIDLINGGTDYLNDGVLSVAEQLDFKNRIDLLTDYYVNDVLPPGYQPIKYDVYGVQLLCCNQSMTVYVNITYGKICREMPGIKHTVNL